MTTYFVSRHPGAIEWAQRRGCVIDRHVAHLEPEEVQAGDTVIGSLPVNLAADICARGAHYLHLSLVLPPMLRGQELTAEVMEQLGAHIQAFEVHAINTPSP
jgi:CRISPR-associated protein Csx16